MNGSLPHDYMEKDVFLIKWLRGLLLKICIAESFLEQKNRNNKMNFLILLRCKRLKVIY